MIYPRPVNEDRGESKQRTFAYQLPGSLESFVRQNERHEVLCPQCLVEDSIMRTRNYCNTRYMEMVGWTRCSLFL